MGSKKPSLFNSNFCSIQNDVREIIDDPTRSSSHLPHTSALRGANFVCLRRYSPTALSISSQRRCRRSFQLISCDFCFIQVFRKGNHWLRVSRWYVIYLRVTWDELMRWFETSLLSETIDKLRNGNSIDCICSKYLTFIEIKGQWK